MADTTLLRHVTALLDRAYLSQGVVAHARSGMRFLRFDAATLQDATVHRPLPCLVLQGAKEVGTSARTLPAAKGQSLVVSHALPVTSRITEATSERPYVALVFPLDLDLVRGLASDLSPSQATSPRGPFSISLCQTDPDMEDALLRYLRQCEFEDGRRMLAPITRQEIHARLLIGSHAEQLRKLLWHETSASRIFRATLDIQSDLSETIAVGELAHCVGMSSSAFFKHFKSVTGTTPLRHQKDLRLLRTRDNPRNTNAKVSDIAFGVGYESSAQFSREYARKFGRPPRQERSIIAAG